MIQLKALAFLLTNCVAAQSNAALQATPSFPACFVDDTQNRQLPHQVCLENEGCEMLTLEWCAAQCKGLGFTLAAVEASHQCTCGNSLTSPAAVAPTSDCNATCTGHWRNEQCGGDLRAWVFEVSSMGPPPPQPEPPKLDSRSIPNGAVLHSGGYTCQPYCSVLPDASWSCVMTFIPNSWIEGQPGEHMVGMRTSDNGQTWTDFVTIEPYDNATTAQASAYGSVTARPDGSRMFALWVQNTGNTSHLPNQPPNPTGFRADMLGDFVWKFSEDGGATWSDHHYTIPVPETFIDRGNSFNGTTRINWQVDQLKQHNGSVLFAFTKIGTYAVAPPEEVYFMRSPNLLTEDDPALVEWEMFPKGDHGVQVPGGTCSDAACIVEEPHILPLKSVDAYHVVFRTQLSYLGSAQSTTGDEYAPWHDSGYAQYLPLELGDDWVGAFGNGSAVKNPRGPISPKMQPNGQLLMTYYNNGGFGAFATKLALSDRNMMWLTAGHEVKGTLFWTQPELLLYDADDRSHGHGYPDLITNPDGSIFVTEAFKAAPYSMAKTHAVSARLVELLLEQRTIKDFATDGLVVGFVGGAGANFPAGYTLPNFSTLPHERYGLTVGLWLGTESLPSSAVDNERTVLLTSSGVPGNSGAALFQVTVASNGTAFVDMQDSDANVAQWLTDPVCSARLATASDASPRHLALVVDAGARTIMWLVDGHLCDGGPQGSAINPTTGPSAEGFAAGWSLFTPWLGDVGGGAGGFNVSAGVKQGRLYSRALYTTEVIGNFRSGLL